MGKVTRKRYGAEFKAKVALEAIKGELTLAELSAKHGIHQTMIATWKRQAIEGVASTFSGKTEAARATGEAELTRLHAEALEEALARHGRPEIFNTDQGSQFTSLAFTQLLMEAGIRISMDGRGRWMDNDFIERLWRSLKYECVYLHAFETGLALHAGLLRWIGHYHMRRPHSSLAGRTPDEAYNEIGLPLLPEHAPAAEASLKMAA